MGDAEKTTEDSILSADESSTSGFIDDYSHLRLSYHRDMDESWEIVEMSSWEIVEMSQDEAEVSNVSDKTDDASDARQKLREFWISQMPDLPHPSVTMASIISSASQKMGMVQLKYSDRSEPGQISQNESQPSPNRFSPQRRSTLNCKGLPK
ncbi:uncharacterized protein LOC114364316 [Ostrinia furnacalis]|uniref:uncharacterized protein LOC114364316 n=1 Tax=Ostrinia furnacalis TaxID=93504 RepID=UPI00103D24CB|nr:uncharacterized protein LOC114364316 [Ostrinia furnacalis]